MSTIKLDFSKLEGEVVLQFTQKIHSDLDTTEQKALYKIYKDCEQRGRPIIMAVASILNMILTQRRLHFVITKRLTCEAIRKDTNHQSGFDNSKYKVLHNILVNDMCILEVTHKGSGLQPTGYKVIHPDIKNLLLIDETKQQQQVFDFINKQTVQPATQPKSVSPIDCKAERPIDRQSETPVVLEADIIKPHPFRKSFSRVINSNKH